MATTSPGAILKETAAIAGICGPGTMTVNDFGGDFAC
jgi:hypothetical protein